jgi:signal transduction histidine kinase
MGIPAESLDAIFEMFSQVGRPIQVPSGGLGIGLALVKGLVEMHGGSVAAESDGAGRGSVFTLRLPLPVAAATRAAEALSA